LRRNNPISNGRLFPRSRIAFRSVVPRSATFGSRAAAFKGASERRSVSIALISATVRGRTPVGLAKCRLSSVARRNYVATEAAVVGATRKNEPSAGSTTGGAQEQSRQTDR